MDIDAPIDLAQVPMDDPPGAGAEGRRRRTKAWMPLAIALVATPLVQLAALGRGVVEHQGFRHTLHDFLFTVSFDWIMRPWTLATSTFAHDLGRPSLLLLGAMGLTTLAPAAERLLGTRRTVTLFLLGGAVTGAAQATLGLALGGDTVVQGPSGALLALLGALLVLRPQGSLFMFGIFPTPTVFFGALYIVLDLGVMDLAEAVANLPHLFGLAIGLLYGRRRQRMAAAAPPPSPGGAGPAPPGAPPA
jgi:membrane associated rhomboid family serine protease